MQQGDELQDPENLKRLKLNFQGWTGRQDSIHATPLLAICCPFPHNREQGGALKIFRWLQ